MIGNFVSTGMALHFTNAFLVVVLISLSAMLANFILGQVRGVYDVGQRLLRIVMHDYQGGAYDFAIAVAVMVMGEVIRSATVWHWLRTGTPMAVEMLLIGVVLTGIGGLCAIRILARCRHYNLVWISVGLGAVAFASLSVWLKG